MSGTSQRTTGTFRVALVWRGDREMRASATAENSRLSRIFAALAAHGINAEPAVYSEEMAEEVRAQLEQCNGVLVWVDPLSSGKTRGGLDPMLRALASRGVFVSTHPDTILKMGTKEVLHRTKELGWGADTQLYRTKDAFRSLFPRRLKEGAPRVLKQNRGNGGQGVWKVERLSATRVRVLEAWRGSVPEELALDAFLERCEIYFEDGGLIVDQPFQPRLPEGMIRCYMGKDKVVGYGHQLIKALIPPPPQGPDSPEAQPGPRIMHPASAPQFARLRALMEDEWIPQSMATLELSRAHLPIVWDADFLYGPKTPSGEDTYVLCEINVSSVFPIPDDAPEAIARLTREALERG
jgi:hypothetical protein